MGWIWRKLGWLAWVKFRFWYLVVTLGGLTIGGEAIWKLLHHDRVDARVERVVAGCEVKCKKIRHTIRHAGEKGSCIAVRAYIAANALTSCRAKSVNHYELSYLTPTGGQRRMDLPENRLAGQHGRGDVVSMMRDPSAQDGKLAPPPREYEIAALGVGLILTAWIFRRRLARLLRRSGSKSPRSTSPRRPLRPARHVVNGPIKTYRRRRSAR